MSPSTYREIHYLKSTKNLVKVKQKFLNEYRYTCWTVAIPVQKDLLLNTNILEYNQLAAIYVSYVYYKETWTLKHVANLCAFMKSMAIV